MRASVLYSRKQRPTENYYTDLGRKPRQRLPIEPGQEPMDES